MIGIYSADDETKNLTFVWDYKTSRLHFCHQYLQQCDERYQEEMEALSWIIEDITILPSMVTKKMESIGYHIAVSTHMERFLGLQTEWNGT